MSSDSAQESVEGLTGALFQRVVDDETDHVGRPKWHSRNKPTHADSQSHVARGVIERAKWNEEALANRPKNGSARDVLVHPCAHGSRQVSFRTHKRSKEGAAGHVEASVLEAIRRPGDDEGDDHPSAVPGCYHKLLHTTSVACAGGMRRSARASERLTPAPALRRPAFELWTSPRALYDVPISFVRTGAK